MSVRTGKNNNVMAQSARTNSINHEGEDDHGERGKREARRIRQPAGQPASLVDDDLLFF